MDIRRIKKLFTLILSALLVFSFAGCSYKRMAVNNPPGMTPVETVQRYFYYWQEKNADGMNSLVYRIRCTEKFERYKYLKLNSCVENKENDYDWDESWYDNAYERSGVDVTFDESYKRDGDNFYTDDACEWHFYLFKKTKDSNWLIAEWAGK